jgi:tripartite-type tricarboxylate transporter receptor subunit TctC
MKNCVALLIAALWLTATPCGVNAQDAVAEFYTGKTVTIAIGSTPGGGYDSYGRLMAKHLGRFIPGHPAVIASNMPGAGSNAAAAAVYNTLPKDGTYIGAIYASAMLEPLIGDGSRIRHDPSKFQNLGSASNEVYTCVVRNDAPIKTLEDARTTETILGATADGGSTVDFPAILTRFFGAKFKVVRGYAGSREVLLAMERGEVQGACGLTWSVLSTQFPDLFTDGRFRMLLQEDMAGNDELNGRGIPVAGKLAADEQTRAALELFYAQNVLGRPYVLAPEAPVDRVAALRAAFIQALKDPELIADAKNMRLTVNPQSGEEVQTLITKLYATPKDVIEAVRTTLARVK